MALFGGPDIEELKAQRDFSGLAEALKHRKPETRTAAAEAIAELGDEAAMPAMMSAFEGEQRPDRLAAGGDAMRGLGEVAINWLLAAARDSADESGTQLRAMGALAAIGGERGLAALGELARDSDQLVRGLCTMGLSDLGGDGAVETLAVLAKDDEPSVRMMAVRGLAAIGTPRARELVREALADPEDMVRSMAESVSI